MPFWPHETVSSKICIWLNMVHSMDMMSLKAMSRYCMWMYTFLFDAEDIRGSDKCNLKVISSCLAAADLRD